MFLNMMQDWAGWLLMLFSFSIVLMWKRVRSDTKVVYAIWFCMCLYHVVAFLNVYLGGVLGTEGDARTFHFYAVDASSEPEIGFLTNTRVAYTNTLGFFYRAFGTSFLLGNELSVLAFTLSCIVLVRLVSLLDLERFRIAIVLFFGLLPSSVIFRSVTLRESWQALFFLLSVYWAVRLRKRPGILIFLYMLMSALCIPAASSNACPRGTNTPIFCDDIITQTTSNPANKNLTKPFLRPTVTQQMLARIKYTANPFNPPCSNAIQ